MMELKVPIIIDGVKTVEELARRVLDEYEYKGMTIRQWADRIANPKTRGDNVRSMTDDELVAMFLAHDDQLYRHCPSDECAELCQAEPGRKCCECKDCWLEWLKQEVEDGKTDKQ